MRSFYCVQPKAVGSLVPRYPVSFLPWVFIDMLREGALSRREESSDRNNFLEF